MGAAARPIGVFDSGIGGLTVLREIRRLLPGENLEYFGDTARVPYGAKSAETVRTYAAEITQFLLSRKVKAVVVACNTVSATALDFLRVKFPSVPVFGVVEPGVLRALAVTKNRRVGVIGTVATVRSSAYKKGLLKRNPSLKVYQTACPLFVPLAEEGWAQHKVAELTARTYLLPLKAKGVDTLVLGCTHYPILKQVIRKVMGREVRLVDSAEEMALNIHAYLSAEGLGRAGKGRGRMVCWLSDRSPSFLRTAEGILREKVTIRLKRF